MKKILKKGLVFVLSLSLLSTGLQMPFEKALPVSAADVSAQQIINTANKYMNNNWSYFNEHGGIVDSDWCAWFVSKCLSENNVTEIPDSCSRNCTDMVNNFIKKSKFTMVSPYNGGFRATVSGEWVSGSKLPVNTTYKPRVGDIVFFDWDNSGDPDHVGFVKEYVSGQGRSVTIRTIEGNQDSPSGYYGTSKVSAKDRSSYIFGFASPSYVGNTVVSTTVKKSASLNHSRECAVDTAFLKSGQHYTTSIAFVNEVLAAAKAKTFSNTTSIGTMVTNYVQNGAYHAVRNTFTNSCGATSAKTLNLTYNPNYTPRPGDIVALETCGGFADGADRVAIVGSVDGTGIQATIHVIEVNTSTGNVCTNKYTNTSNIWGYCSPYYAASDLGDFNQDGVINNTDLTQFKASGFCTKSVYQTLCMDMDQNGKTEITDGTYLAVKINDTRCFEGETLFAQYHHVGSKFSTYCEANTGDDAAGYLTYGPYITGISTGFKTAAFKLRIDNNTANNDQVATIDVRDATTKQDLVSRKLYRKDFIFACAYQEFQLHFKNYNSSHALEFRVYFTDKARLSFDKVTITSNATTYEGESAAISHKTGGLAESNTCWQATVQNSAGHMAYGPYENGVPVGSRTVNFRLKIDNNTADNYNVAGIDVFDSTAQKLLGSRNLYRKDFAKANTYQNFAINFTSVDASHDLEFRVYYVRNSALSLDKITLS